jgi:outer membrane biosynthesis protein TonB
MVFRLVLFVAVASVLLTENAQQPVTACCQADSESLSRQQLKALVNKTKPIHAPCCADMLHISGTVVLAISVDPEGNVTCVQMVSGPPLAVGVAIDSVKQWKFRPYTPKETKKSFCGQIALRCEGNEHGIRYKIL